MTMTSAQTGRLAALDPVWRTLRDEAEALADSEPTLAAFAHDAVLRHDRLEAVIAHRVAQKLSDATVSAAALRDMAEAALDAEPRIASAARADLVAVRDRDPACERLLEPMLYFKGFQAVTAHRVAHWLWAQGRRDAALFLQSRCSELYAIDIHPAARIGRGIMIDHAHAIVIGETAVVGDDVSMLHDVTLGGTGKEHGDRHPKIGNGVLIGAGAKILGNIRVGCCSRVAAGSVVLKDVPDRTTVAGVPAKVVGDAGCPEPARAMEHGFTLRGGDAEDIVPDC